MYTETVIPTMVTVVSMIYDRDLHPLIDTELKDIDGRNFNV